MSLTDEPPQIARRVGTLAFPGSSLSCHWAPLLGRPPHPLHLANSFVPFEVYPQGHFHWEALQRLSGLSSYPGTLVAQWVGESPHGLALGSPPSSGLTLLRALSSPPSSGFTLLGGLVQLYSALPPLGTTGPQLLPQAHTLGTMDLGHWSYYHFRLAGQDSEAQRGESCLLRSHSLSVCLSVLFSTILPSPMKSQLPPATGSSLPGLC